MLSRMTVTPSGELKASLAELCKLLLLLVEWRSRSLSEEALKDRLPGWLLERFSPEMTMEQKYAWLSRWRDAPLAGKVKLEGERGWEFSQWCHWFTSDNDVWLLSSAVLIDEKLIVELRHEDEPFPIGALEWMFGVAGARIESMERIL